MSQEITKDQFDKAKEIRVAEFKRAFKGMVAASEQAYEKSNSKFPKKRRSPYSRDEIIRIVEQGNSVEQAKLSQHFFETNGLYKRIILHYATFLTYSWILIPYVKDKFKKTTIRDRRVSAAYYNASDFCTNFQIERKCTLFAREVLVKGGYYGLIYDDGDNVVIQDLPFEYCRSRFKNVYDVDIVEFNVKFFDTIRDAQLRDEILNTYPKFVIKGYRRYKYNGENEWVFLPAEMGIYFSYFEERPLFLDLIPLLDDLNDYKEIDKARNIKALKRILVQKVPRDGTKLVFEPDEAEEMHEGTIEMMANNEDVDVLTTYNDVSLLDMSSDDDQKTQIQDIQDLIYSSAGLSKELFFSTTEAGLAYSVNNDLAMMMILGQKFAHFFTVLLNYKFENKKVRFKLIILPLSYYNSADYTSRARELASFGYSFLTPILSTGLDQTTLAALKELENDLLELDEVLKPLQSSYTQSGKKSGEPMGKTAGSAATVESNDEDNSKNNDKEDKEEENSNNGSEKDNE